MKAFMTVNALVKELVSSSEIGRPIVTTLMLVKFFEKSASSLKILSRKIYKCQWRPGIFPFFANKISPIAVVDRLDEDQQELMIEWLRALS